MTPKQKSTATGALIITVALVIIGFIGKAIYDSITQDKKDAANKDSAGGTNTNTSTPPSTPSTPGWTPSSDNIKTIQQFLNANKNAGLTVDGQFGPLTTAAYKAAGFSVPVKQADYNQINWLFTMGTSAQPGTTMWSV